MVSLDSTDKTSSLLMAAPQVSKVNLRYVYQKAQTCILNISQDFLQQVFFLHF